MIWPQHSDLLCWHHKRQSQVCAWATLKCTLFNGGCFFFTANDVSNKRSSHNGISAILTKLGTLRFVLTRRCVMVLRRDGLIILGTFLTISYTNRTYVIRPINFCKKEMCCKIACDFQNLRLQQTCCCRFKCLEMFTGELSTFYRDVYWWIEYLLR